MNKIILSIVIPAYNEEKKIEKDLREAFRFLDSNNINGEIIISTDGVTDKTNEIVKMYQEENKNLRLIAKNKKAGKGAALKKGVAEAKGKYIIFADAGYCVPFKYILEGMKKIDEGYNCVLGSRAIKKSQIIKKQPLYRRIGSAVFGIIVKTLIGIPSYIKDTQCGFKMYNYETAKKLFGELRTQGMMFDIELILRARKHTYSIVQFPVEWRNDNDTKFNPWKGFFSIIKELYKIKVKYKL